MFQDLAIIRETRRESCGVMSGRGWLVARGILLCALCLGISIPGTHALANTSPDAVRGELGRSSSSAAEKLRTCRHCKSSFAPSQNHDRACRYHSEFYSGETRQRFQSAGQKQLPGEKAGDLMFHWWCCGQAEPTSPGCCFRAHASYDDL